MDWFVGVILFLFTSSCVYCQDCHVDNFEDTSNTLVSGIGPCFALPPWFAGRYSQINIDSYHENSLSFISPPAVTTGYGCVLTPTFPIAAGGILQFNVFTQFTSLSDLIMLVAYEGENDSDDRNIVGYISINLSSGTNWGWNVINVTVSGSGTFDGYVTFLGRAVLSSTLLIDSFRYIPPEYINTHEDYCEIYTEDTTTTESTTTESTTTTPTTTESTTTTPTTTESTTTTPTTTESTTTTPTTTESTTTTPTTTESTTTESTTTTSTTTESTTTESTTTTPTTTESTTTTSTTTESTTTTPTTTESTTTTPTTTESTTTESTTTTSTTTESTTTTSTTTESTTTTPTTTETTTTTARPTEDICITYDFDEEFKDLFTDPVNQCFHINVPWIFHGHGIIPRDIEISSCISSPIFKMAPGGTLKIDYNMKLSHFSSLSIVVRENSTELIPNVMYSKSISSTLLDTEDNTAEMVLRGNSAVQSYFTIIGYASAKASVLVKSFKYIPPSGNADNCVPFAELFKKNIK